MMTIRMAGVCLLAAGLVSVAQEEGVVGFKHTLSAGVALTDGNSETLQANAAFLTEGEKAGLGSVRAGLEGNYGESTVDDATDTTVENARAFAGARKTLSPRTYTSLDASVMYDNIAGPASTTGPSWPPAWAPIWSRARPPRSRSKPVRPTFGKRWPA